MRPKTLKSASEAGDLDAVKYHLEKGAEINATTSAGHFALGGAIINGHLQVVKYLIAHGANINQKSEYSWTPLYLAAWKGHANIAAELIRSGAPLQSCTKSGYQSPDRWTPLHVAASGGHIEVVRLLVGAGARTDLKDGEGRTPLDLAIAHRRRTVASLLKGEQMEDKHMQMVIQVVCSKAESLREIIVNDNSLTNFNLEVVSEKTQGRSPGWTKVRCKVKGANGSINIDWSTSTKILTCRVVTRGGGNPNQTIGHLIDYLLAHHRSRIKVITIFP